MDRFGFIHEELDIKILILFILKRLPGYVEPETLCELCQCDGGVGYFDYSDCLSDLIENGNVEQGEDGYRITPKGEHNADVVENSLPYSVRSKAERLIEPVEERLRRAAMIKAAHTLTDGECKVKLSMSDGKGQVIELELLCLDEKQAKKIEKNFRKNAEEYYQRIMEMLSEDRKK